MLIAELLLLAVRRGKFRPSPSPEMREDESKPAALEAKAAAPDAPEKSKSA
jgi:hypothetical protein